MTLAHAWDNLIKEKWKKSQRKIPNKSNVEGRN
jgi:hypothetical protein